MSEFGPVALSRPPPQHRIQRGRPHLYLLQPLRLSIPNLTLPKQRLTSYLAVASILIFPQTRPALTSSSFIRAAFPSPFLPKPNAASHTSSCFIRAASPSPFLPYPLTRPDSLLCTACPTRTEIKKWLLHQGACLLHHHVGEGMGCFWGKASTRVDNYWPASHYKFFRSASLFQKS